MIVRSAPTYHRQRFLLFLLERTGCILLSDFQKLLFLWHRENTINYYDFVRYEGSYYSFQASSDLEVLAQKDWIVFAENTIFLKDKPFLSDGVKNLERQLIAKWLHVRKELLSSGLTEFIDNNYPENTQNYENDIDLFTIGYEGSSLETYLTKLIENNVQVLYDVRKNPFSHKFGFSKGNLSKMLSKFDIEYRHIPELGIVSEKRQNLDKESDYIKLFDEYKKNLPNKKIYLQDLVSTLEQGKRIALTCFEEKPKSCHRHCVSDYLANHSDIKVVHL
jgi:hypothetical protein